MMSQATSVREVRRVALSFRETTPAYSARPGSPLLTGRPSMKLGIRAGAEHHDCLHFQLSCERL